MISHEHKCVFVHIPKNAGQSIEHVFLELLGLSWDTRAPLLMRHNDVPELGPPRLAHLKAHEYLQCKYLSQDMFDTYFKFSIVRNPWSRLVSIYRYLGYDKRSEFPAFVKGKFRKKLFRNRRWFVGPQSDFVCGSDGQVLTDYIGRFESLQTSFDQICARIGLPQMALPHVNESTTSALSRRGSPKAMARNLWASIRRYPKYGTYQEYYDKDSEECVGELYRDDIERFGYAFD